MEDDPFDSLIRAAKERTLPACPPGLEDDVLRRIRTVRMDGEKEAPGWILSLFPRPAVVAAALALTVAVSSLATFVASSSHAVSMEKRNLASSALDFSYFKETRLLTLPGD